MESIPTRHRAHDALGLLVQCRPGFEADAGQELQASPTRLAAAVHGQPQSGFVFLALEQALPHDELRRRLDVSRLVFARQSCQVLAVIDDLPERDRLTPLVQRIEGFQERFSALLLETPDTNEGKQQSGFLRRFGPLLEAALGKAGCLRPDSPHLPSLHVFFVGARQVWLGVSLASEGSAWPMGIPRLRMPKEAPSRSTLKLAEAILTLLSPDEQKSTLRPGLTAVDLGAAPGGWSWQLVSRGLRVTAIDNGPIAPSVTATGLIEHLRADGLTWRPKKPVEWMVCDMVEQPRKVAERMATWFREGWCRNAVFNLKLPMKKRWQETLLALDLFANNAGEHDTLVIRARQLYHDREEITVYASVE